VLIYDPRLGRDAWRRSASARGSQRCLMGGWSRPAVIARSASRTSRAAGRSRSSRAHLRVHTFNPGAAFHESTVIQTSSSMTREPVERRCAHQQHQDCCQHSSLIAVKLRDARKVPERRVPACCTTPNSGTFERHGCQRQPALPGSDGTEVADALTPVGHAAIKTFRSSVCPVVARGCRGWKAQRAAQLVTCSSFFEEESG
jgi:hypothetical protein